MAAVRPFFLGLREVFTLEHAEQRVRALGEEERARRARYVRAAKARRAASRKLSNSVAAVVLLRDALELALRATRPEAERIDVAAALDAATAADARVAGARRRITEHLASPSPLALDALSFSDAEALRNGFEECLAFVLADVDTRSLLAVRALRAGRLAALVLVTAWLLATYVHSRWMIHNVAIGKVVTSTPLKGESPTPDHLVDGDIRGTFGIHTLDADRPFVMIDLAEPYAIDHVRVLNRRDGWFDDCLPLRMELSNDGIHFDEVARRDEHFDAWTVRIGGRRARFVRLSKPDRGYITLNEIEVYGRR